ncbi:hypothetical protein R6Q57_006239 [Mikania cordata]
MAHRCFVALTLITTLCLVIEPVYSQINTPCSASMITSFTPCLNFLTNSTSNGATTPTSDCCNALKSLTSRGTDCLCLIVTGSVPFQIPINRTLAVSMPRACQTSGVPLQCKGPATLLGPAPSPGSSSTDPEALLPESNITPPLAPESDTTPAKTPPSTGVASGVPTTNAGSRPTLTPSGVAFTYASSSFVFVVSGVAFILSFLF